jgi:hypothetical protein
MAYVVQTVTTTQSIKARNLFAAFSEDRREEAIITAGKLVFENQGKVPPALTVDQALNWLASNLPAQFGPEPTHMSDIMREVHIAFIPGFLKDSRVADGAPLDAAARQMVVLQTEKEREAAQAYILLKGNFKPLRRPHKPAQFLCPHLWVEFARANSLDFVCHTMREQIREFFAEHGAQSVHETFLPRYNAAIEVLEAWVYLIPESVKTPETLTEHQVRLFFAELEGLLEIVLLNTTLESQRSTACKKFWAVVKQMHAKNEGLNYGEAIETARKQPETRENRAPKK